ncbi:MAG: hypothetical protein HOC81_11080 [Candidatus Marinimicrobia bacterium]|jgi:hypothetical protein|nr:hypothetical protein [Candidatus Neomarinimicrobiota bacterium]MBT4420747.1 hypothetical protein [Candidatus Neomarinimicrobiota bacterium]MBT4991799.1 hypothetical protein [Candidatus Neomarinimicrobiota bacterium]MBT5465186.1 hypothetical protein [Candidatus Neomarinimicrobiota bacterium]MBT6758696.1 hypothetical protein [Candidatus Neomarinimicrobiota bacterium]
MNAESFHRTPLKQKFDIIIRLICTLRFYGDNEELIPQFRKVAHEMDMTHQNLQFIWRNRNDIIERAKRKLPSAYLAQCHSLHYLKYQIIMLRMLDSLADRDYSKASTQDLLSYMRSITEMYFVENELKTIRQSVCAV